MTECRAPAQADWKKVAIVLANLNPESPWLGMDEDYLHRKAGQLNLMVEDLRYGCSCIKFDAINLARLPTMQEFIAHCDRNARLRNRSTPEEAAKWIKKLRESVK